MKILLVVGARPNFMKVAPIIRAIAHRNARAAREEKTLSHILVHTGQHYDPRMSDVFFQELNLPEPDFHLGVGSGSHAVQTAGVMTRFEPLCLDANPDWVVVVGDVNSTMACALVAAKLGIKVAHVEAGLRSFDRTMPEEINRVVTDSVADLLLTPSEGANKNLRQEGAPDSKIILVGNVMIDSLVASLGHARARSILGDLNVSRGNFAYVTLHRPGNVDARDSLTRIAAELRHLAGKMPVVFPLHPRTRKRFGEFGINLNDPRSLRFIEPVGYLDSLCLAENARFVLTDSGGLQEETTYFRVPCLTLRPNTERPVTIEVGSNRLTSLDRLSSDITNILAQDGPRGQIPPLWDGQAGERILNALIA